MDGIPSLWQGVRNRFKEAAKEHPTLRVCLASGSVERRHVQHAFGPECYYTLFVVEDDFADNRATWYYDEDLTTDWEIQLIDSPSGMDSRTLIAEYHRRRIAFRDDPMRLIDAESAFKTIAADAGWAITRMGGHPKLTGVPSTGHLDCELIWLWVLFHVALNLPDNSLLRAVKSTPGDMLRDYIKLSGEVLDGFKPDDFVAYLGHDPFTSSVHMIDYLVAGDAKPGTKDEPPEVAVNKPEAGGGNGLKRPPDRAIMAWRLRDLLGIGTQNEIATKMTQQGYDCNQGQVSRWLRQVERYLAEGGVLPAMETAQKETAVDPAVIELGARQDGLTPRQREKKTAGPEI